MPNTSTQPGRLATLALLWLVGVYMRAPMLVAAPLGAKIQPALHLDQTSLGALTTLPVLMFGLGALPGAWLIARFGARNVLMAALALAAAASALRGVAPDVVSLLVLTGLMGLGIAAMQPALPALVPRWCPGLIALGSTVYLNGMMCGEFIGAGLTLPVLLPLAGGSWRAALVVFSLPVLLIVPLLLVPQRHGEPASPAGAPRLPAWRDHQLWRFGTLLGATAATFFGLNAYMVSVLADKGMADQLGLVLGVFNITQLIASLLMMGMARRILAVPRLLFISMLIHVAGVAGMLWIDNTLLLLAAVAISLASAVQLISLTSLPALTRAPDDAGRLAAGMFALGYVLAFVIPLIAGAAADAAGTTTAALALFLVLNVGLLPLAWRTGTGMTATERSSRH